MLDVPNFFWESEPTLYPLYIAVREYLEIKPRIQVLNERCRVFLDLAEILSDSIADNRTSRMQSSIMTFNTQANIHRSNLDHHRPHHHLHPRHHLRSLPPFRPPLRPRERRILNNHYHPLPSPRTYFTRTRMLMPSTCCSRSSSRHGSIEYHRLAVLNIPYPTYLILTHTFSPHITITFTIAGRITPSIRQLVSIRKPHTHSLLLLSSDIMPSVIQSSQFSKKRLDISSSFTVPITLPLVNQSPNQPTTNHNTITFSPKTHRDSIKKNKRWQYSIITSGRNISIYISHLVPKARKNE